MVVNCKVRSINQVQVMPTDRIMMIWIFSSNLLEPL